MQYTFQKPRRPIDTVFVHCSASDHAAHDNVATMRAWHLRRGWSDVGYHFFIRKDGTLEIGRSIEKTPAAQGGHNRGTIAICLHGLHESKFTPAQFETLRALCGQINRSYGKGRIRFRGHNEVAAKLCPVFDHRDVLSLSGAGKLGDGLGYAGRLDMGLPKDMDQLEEAEAKATHRATLRSGNRGPAVRALQQELADLGYHVGAIDEYFGKRTRAAVLAFQADNHLVEDGVVGAATYEALEDAQPREVADERASKSVFGLAKDGSRIATASVTQGAVGVGVIGGGALQAFQAASTTVDQITDAAAPFQNALQGLGPWIGGAICLAGAIVIWQAIKAGRARAEDHRTGKTL